MNKMNIADCAAILAQRIHKGQTDKAGFDYFEGHLTHVASCCYDINTKVMAFLHDAAEDTSFSEEEIIEQLDAIVFENLNKHLSDIEIERFVSGLKLLNQNNYNSREEYLEGLKKDSGAMFVKITDLRHNKELSRIPNPTVKDFQRSERYKLELSKLVQWYNDPSLW